MQNVHEMDIKNDDSLSQNASANLKIKQKKKYRDYDSGILEQEGYNTRIQYKEWIEDKDAKLKKLDKLILQDYKIPVISHVIYFSNEDSPIPIKEYHQAMMINSASILSKENGNFKHYFWTTNINLLPENVQKIPGLEIHMVSELSEHMLYPVLLNILDRANKERGYFAQASDIARILVLQKYGGIYHDNDYEILSSKIVGYFRAFNFFGTKEFLKKDSFIANCVMAGAANHPIFNSAVHLIARNLKLLKDCPPPDYVLNPATFGAKVIFETSPKMFEIAYYKGKNLEGNVDMIFPANILSDTEYVRSKYSQSRYYKAMSLEVSLAHEAVAVGGDLFSGDWQDNGTL